MSKQEENKVVAHRGLEFHATIRSQSFWLELGDLRRLLAESADMPDNASVTFEGGRSAAEHVDEYHVGIAHVRHTDWDRAR